MHGIWGGLTEQERDQKTPDPVRLSSDLRGFGDSDTAPGDYTSTTAAEDLHQLIAHLGACPVHLTGQDISGATVFRLAATRPEDVLSSTAIMPPRLFLQATA